MQQLNFEEDVQIEAAAAVLKSTAKIDPISALGKLASKMSIDDLIMALPDDVITKIASHKVQADMKQLNDFLQDPNLCIKLQVCLRIGRRKFDLLRRFLFRVVDLGEEKLVHRSIGGVKLKGFASDVSMRAAKLKKQNDPANGLTVTDKGVLFDLPISIMKAIKQIKHTTAFKDLLSKGEKIQALYMADSANCFTNMEQTTGAIKLPNCHPEPNRPLAMQVVNIYEGSDTYDSFGAQCENTLNQLNAMIKDGGLGDHEIHFLLGGDLKFILSILGHCGASSTYPCGQCEVETADVCSTDLEKLKKITRRSVERCKLLSHTAYGKQCPVCDKKITHQDFDSVSESKKQEHARTHFGIKLGFSPLTNIEPNDHMICLLHLLLRVVSSLWQATVVPFLSDFNVPFILEVLKKIKVHIPARKLKKIGKRFDLYNLQAAIQKHNFNGAACIQLLVFFDEVFEALFKKQNDETKTASEAQAELSCRNLWILFRNFWVSLTTDFDDPLVEKETQSQKIQFNAKLFVEGWNSVAGKNKSAYMHYLLVHLEEQVARFGDLRKYSAQGLEHLHSIFKSLLFSNTNRHVVDRVRQEAVCVMYGATNPQGHSEIERAALENGKRKRAIARKVIKFTKKEVIQEKPLLALADITNTYRPRKPILPPPPLPPPPPPVARHPVVTAESITPQLSKANAATHALLKRAKESMKIQQQQRKRLKSK